MRRTHLVTLLTLTAFLAASLPAAAEPVARVARPDPQTSSLKASIDRAAEQAAAQYPGLPTRRATPVRKQMSGGGGGGGMMVMTLLVTAASLAGTYFVVKELKKTTDEATRTAQ